MPGKECGATSRYGAGNKDWTYTCHLPADHEPGEHDYTLDDGQDDPPNLETDNLNG